VVALIPYWIPGYLLMSKQTEEPSMERIWTCFYLYIFGVVMMLGSDGQKYFMLRERYDCDLIQIGKV
jgi:hypothetical protein